MKAILTNLSWLLLVTWTSVCHADNWTSFQAGGKTLQQGPVPLTWSPKDRIAWSFPITGYGQSAPVVWANQVYVTSCKGQMKEDLYVFAVNVTTGKQVWDYRLSSSSPQKNTSYVSKAAPTPVVDKLGVIAFFEGGNLVALDHQGKVRWTRDLVKDYGDVKARHGLASSLEQNDEFVFVWVERSKNPYVLGVNKLTGKTEWKSVGVGKTAWSSPRLVPVAGKTQLVCSAIGRIVGFDPGNGHRLWEYDEISNNTTPTPIPLGEGAFLIGASEGRGQQAANAVKSNGIVKITRNRAGKFSARFVWRAAKANSSFGSPIIAAGRAYFVNRSGVVYCVNAADGKPIYTKRIAGSVWATPIQVRDRIYLFARNGQTSVIQTGDRFKLLATNTLWKNAEPKASPGKKKRRTSRFGSSGPVLYAAIIANNSFLLRRGDRLYCVR